MCAWVGPGVPITHKQDRISGEQQWFAMTGRVVQIRAEEDGDLHVVLEDAIGGKPGKVVVEVPLEARWCPIRTKIFSWTDASFPFETRRGNDFSLVRPQTVSVIGKVFYDVDHAGRDTRNNKRNYDPLLSVWEIHPVMKMDVLESGAPAPATSPTAAIPKVATAPTPTAAPLFLTILSPTPVAVPYGQVTLTKGMRLEIISRSGASVTVRYMNNNYTIPAAATDLR